VSIYEREHIASVDVEPRPHLSALTFSPDDSRLACGDSRTIEVVDLAHGGKTIVLEGHDSAIASLELTADNTHLVSTSTDHAARVWNLADRTAKVLRGHTKRITTIEVDGDVVVTASLDHSARLWDLAAEIGRPLRGHDDAVVFAMRRPDGRIFTLDRDDRTSIYTDVVPYDELGLRVWIAAATNVTRRAPPSR
jgi:WD40 repeat protein